VPTGGFYIFAYKCEILLRNESFINFNIIDTLSKTNIYDYLYGGLELYKEHTNHVIRDVFSNILFRNNTLESMNNIANYLNTKTDHFKTDEYTGIIEKTNLEISTRGIKEREEIRILEAEFKTFENGLTSADYSKSNIEGKKWFNTIPPTLKKHPKPKDIFVGYNEVDYVTYEKIEDPKNRTPMVIGGNIGKNPSTNFRTPSFSKRSIYVLR